ncbi:MAG TPA: hypothetical protein DEA71_02410 [Nitrospira sp.]|nr:hypothetical protein [Nitrospira sp.]
MKYAGLWIAMGVLSLSLSLAGPASAAMMTQLELTGGAVNYDGKYHAMMDRVLGQEGTLKLGQFQAIGELLPSLDKACETYSLFTSGFTGEAAPTATISGSSISIDLSSLFFGISRGDSHKTWNIGELATGQYNPETKEFTVSWDHLFEGGKQEGLATFFLKGIAEMGNQPVAIPASLVLYATGLFGIGSLTWWRKRTLVPSAA